MTATNRQFKQVGFDLDGTLCNSLPGIRASYQYAMEALGLRAKHEYRSAIGKPLAEGLEWLGVPREKVGVAVKTFREYYAEKGLYEAELYNGVPDMLSEMRSAGVPLYIVTAKPTVFAEKVVAHFGVQDLFEAVVGLDLEKPPISKVEQLRGLIQDHKLSGPEFCFVGDRRQDVRAGVENGVPALGVAYGYGGRAELEAAGADLVVDSVAELKRSL